MFLYLGDGKYKRLSSVIGIFDMDSATVCVATRRFLSVHERDGRVESDGELPKSFLLCDGESGEVSKGNKKRKCTCHFPCTSAEKAEKITVYAAFAYKNRKKPQFKAAFS